MSAHAEAAHEHHGPPPIHYSSRVSPAVLGMFLFIASEIMLFGSFFTVYFFDRVVNHGVNGHWPPTPFERPSSSATSTIFQTSDRPERPAAAMYGVSWGRTT